MDLNAKIKILVAFQGLKGSRLKQQFKDRLAVLRDKYSNVSELVNFIEDTIESLQ